MGSAIGLRSDFDGPALRRLARASKSANQARRLLALAEIYDGGSRTAAARILADSWRIVPEVIEMLHVTLAGSRNVKIC